MAQRQVSKATHIFFLSFWRTTTRHSPMRSSISRAITLIWSKMRRVEITKILVSIGSSWALNQMLLSPCLVPENRWRLANSHQKTLCNSTMHLLRNWKRCHQIPRWCSSVHSFRHQLFLRLKTSLSSNSQIRSSNCYRALNRMASNTLRPTLPVLLQRLPKKTRFQWVMLLTRQNFSNFKIRAQCSLKFIWLSMDTESWHKSFTWNSLSRQKLKRELIKLVYQILFQNPSRQIIKSNKQ